MRQSFQKENRNSQEMKRSSKKIKKTILHMKRDTIKRNETTKNNKSLNEMMHYF